MEYKFSYAVYGNNLEQPLVRFDNYEDAHSDLVNNDDGIMIVTEVCEYDNEKLIIKKERVRDAPMNWLPNRFIPDYSGHFLCWVSIKEECGAVNHKPEVVWYDFGQWNSLPNHTVEKWMIIKEPVSDKQQATHELMKFMFLKKQIVNENTGEVLETIGSTTKLSTTEFNEYIDRISQFAAEFLGVEIMPPNTQVPMFATYDSETNSIIIE